MASRRKIVAAPGLPAEVEIRPLRHDDSVEELTRLLHRAYAAPARAGLNYTAAVQTPETTRKRAEHGQCFVAADEAGLVGTILVNASVPNPLGELLGRPRVASIHQFAVAPERQGCGFGSLLLALAESWIRAAGFAQVALDTAESDPRVMAFYVRRGYRSVGSIQWTGKAYRSIIMSKELTGAA
jgi:GNAT superfamily N-acetyltransferase